MTCNTLEQSSICSSLISKTSCFVQLIYASVPLILLDSEYQLPVVCGKYTYSSLIFSKVWSHIQ